MIAIRRINAIAEWAVSYEWTLCVAAAVEDALTGSPPLAGKVP